MTALRDIVDQPPVVAEEHEPLSSAARRMLDQHVGSIVVHTADGGLQGIFTERDLVRACAAGVDTHTATVGRWMTGDPLVAHATDETGDALEQMIDHGIRHLPVLGDEGLIGVVAMKQLSQHLRGRGR